MRILHLYKDYAPVLGGIENHIKLLAEAQAARGHEVTVLVTSRDRRTHSAIINGVRVIYAARLATVSSTPISIAFIQHLREFKPDVTHLHFPYPWAEVANSLFGHSHRAVLTYHSDIVRQKYLNRVYSPLLNRVLARVDTIIATSPNYLSSSPVLSYWKSKSVVVPLGIDPSPFLHLAQTTNRSSTATVAHAQLLFVGKLRYYKGLNYLLQAMCNAPEARLAVVGTGPMEGLWRQLALKLGLSERVIFAGEVVEDTLPAYYAACDVFVLPASERSEAFGLVQLEAMASAKPVISTDVGTGVGWVNQNEVTGLVVPPGNPQALASAINRLITNPQLREKFGAAGRERVLSNFTADRMVDAVMRVYEYRR